MLTWPDSVAEKLFVKILLVGTGNGSTPCDVMLQPSLERFLQFVAIDDVIIFVVKNWRVVHVVLAEVSFVHLTVEHLQLIFHNPAVKRK